MPNIDKDIQKEAVKEALQEWLDKKFAEVERGFGQWAIRGLCAAAFAGVIYIAIIGMGWHK